MFTITLRSALQDAANMSGHDRILIVDDEPQLRRVMKTSLTANGYEAYEAPSGEEALNALRSNDPDLIPLT